MEIGWLEFSEEMGNNSPDAHTPLPEKRLNIEKKY